MSATSVAHVEWIARCCFGEEPEVSQRRGFVAIPERYECVVTEDKFGPADQLVAMTFDLQPLRDACQEDEGEGAVEAPEEAEEAEEAPPSSWSSDDAV